MRSLSQLLVLPSVISIAASSIGAAISSTYHGASTSSSATAATTGKPIFFHYMIGTIYDVHCEQDILDAQSLGVDAFALNIGSLASWATNTTASLFKWAGVHDFKLFFSFDMTGFDNPDEFTSFLESYVTNEAYYLYNDLPFVSTFNGGASTFTFGQDTVNDGWKTQLQDVMAAAGHPIYFVPAFQDVSASADFFTTEFPTVDGAMNWNSWPFAADGDIVVPTTDDKTYLTGAHAAGKTFMMGVSPLQFKHIDSSQNWYRRGEENLEYRFGQVLSLQPDFVEIQTWNDAGESHYMGNSWPEPIDGTTEGAYTTAYNHTEYRQILKAFVRAWKNGDTTTDSMVPTNGADAQGTFWHHTLLKGADCSADALGMPSGVDTVEDKVTAVVLVAEGLTTYNVSIVSGSTTLGSHTLVPGYNSYSVSNMTVGTVVVTVEDTSTGAVVVSGTGPIAVAASSDLCNYNFQVVGLA